MSSPSSWAPGAAAPALFHVREQASDGNCLFRSFSDQIYGTPEYHTLLRDRCSKYIASERNYFEQFIAEPFDEFITRIQREGEWGDDVEIEALSEIFDCRVEIYASHNNSFMRTFHETCGAKWLHPVRLQYEGRAHYNSLTPASGVLVPLARSMPGVSCVPGEIEDAAIARSRRRQEAGQRRTGAAEADAEQTERDVLDESIRQSRLAFEHKSEAEMDETLERSRVEWEKAERRRVDDEVVNAMLKQSALEEEAREENQMAAALQESQEMLMENMLQESAAVYGPVGAENLPGSSSLARDSSSSGEFMYPESVYAVMSMGFPLDKCIQAYQLLGDDAEGILSYACQSLGR